MIRKARLEDSSDINLLGLTLNPNYSSLFKLTDILKQSYAKVYVYIIKDKIIGFIHVNIFAKDCDIINIVVQKYYQRKNIGTQLFKYLIANNNIDRITLEVKAQNTQAINFYKKQGLEILTVRKNYYADGDGYLMGRKYEK